MPQHIGCCISYLNIIIPYDWDVLYYCMFLCECIEVHKHIYYNILSNTLFSTESAPAAEKIPKGPLDMATEESEKKIADAEEEEDKTPPRML